MNNDNMIGKEEVKDTVATAIAVAIASTLNDRERNQEDCLLKYKQNLKKICDGYQEIQVLRKDETKGNYHGLFYQTAWHDHKNGVETEIRMTAAFYGSKAVTDFVIYPYGGGWRGSGVICKEFL